MRRHIILFASISLLACDGTDPVIEPPDESLVRFDPEGDGFYRTPWPSDARLTAAGTPDMTGFPGGRPVAPPLAEIEARVSGFATMPVVYFGLTAPVSADALPQGLDALDPESPADASDEPSEGSSSASVEAGAVDGVDRSASATDAIQSTSSRSWFEGPRMISFDSTCGLAT